MKATAARVEALLQRFGVRLTLGAEPTCVPHDPRGAEWSYTALGPTKLRYARRLAEALIEEALPGGVVFLVPGKSYPGEVNPRWALHCVGRRDRQPLVRPRCGNRRALPRDARAFLARLAAKLKVNGEVQELREPRGRGRAWVLPIDRGRRGWSSPRWRWPASARLLDASGSAGLRLPWNLTRGRGAKRALTVGICDGRLEVFLPPLLQESWTLLLEAVDASLPAGCACDYSGYVPEDTEGCWHSLVVSVDPGVLEVNFPATVTWGEYDRWLRALDRAQRRAGLRSWKKGPDGRPQGTGGGHHLLFGGPDLTENPFFTRPGWLASLLRFWQHHPSLAYLFTGCYVGPASQAPRADESGKRLHDLEMACAWLEALPPGTDQRQMITDTLIHLHSDASGNTHRSEISFDKFWNVRFPGGARGLVEFRALESLPRVSWASAVALLWRALAAHLLARPFRVGLRDFGPALHDRYFLPAWLWEDFHAVLGELAGGGLPLDEDVFRDIWEWRCPALLSTADGLVVRRGLEAWPLLCETPLEGGATSRFVDASLERVEFRVPPEFALRRRLLVNGRLLPLRAMDDGSHLAGLCYRASARHPSLHPGAPVQAPLVLTVEGRGPVRHYVQSRKDGSFRPAPRSLRLPPRGEPCRASLVDTWTFDLRLA